VDYTWGITIDGDLIKKSLRQYIREGRYARVPILGGQVDDEGIVSVVPAFLSSREDNMLNVVPDFSLRTANRLRGSPHRLNT
jgi:acetylcholinesterase